MLTFGGMPGGSAEKRRIKQNRLQNTDYAQCSLSDEAFLFTVSCPIRKEIVYLEFYMPASDDWPPKERDLPHEVTRPYCRMCRSFPSYAELFLYKRDRTHWTSNSD